MEIERVKAMDDINLILFKYLAEKRFKKMKDVISYLKLDLKISKNTILMVIPVLFFMAYMFFEKKAHTFGMTWLILFVIVCTTTPFSRVSYEHLEQMYHGFPVKISKMVLGRFAYLIMWMLLMFFIESILIIYLSNTGEISYREIVTIGLCEAIAVVFCFLEYIVCYIFMNKNNQTISLLLYTMPALLIFMLSLHLLDNKIISDAQVNLIVNNKSIIVTLVILGVAIIGYISYLISCRICKTKDI